METATPIRPTLQSMQVGDQIEFPKSRRKSVRSTASDIKSDTGAIFNTWVKEDILFVKRNK